MNRLIQIFEWNMTAMIVVSLFMMVFYFNHVHASEMKTLHLTESRIAKILISPGRSTVLSFPSKPTKVVLGSQGGFAIEYVESDLAIAALSSHANSNLFVYLEGRRFAFDLATVPSQADTLVFVRDAANEHDPTLVSAPQPTEKRKRTTYE